MGLEGMFDLGLYQFKRSVDLDSLQSMINLSQSNQNSVDSSYVYKLVFLNTFTKIDL